MRVTRHGDHLVQLTKYPGLFPINCFLVVEDESLTLVDTAMGDIADDVERAAKELGKEVKRVLLTHAHGDHIGGVPSIKARFPKAELAIGVRDARLLRGDFAPAPGEPEKPARGVKVDWEPDQLLEEGEKIGSLRAIASPGHSPGHLAFLDERDRGLIAGDALQTRGGTAVAGDMRWIFPFVAMATWDKRLALASARALRALDPARLAVGHGNVLEEPGAAMETAIARAEKAFA